MLIKASDCSAGPDVAKVSPVFLEKMLGIAKRYRDVCYIYNIVQLHMYSGWWFQTCSIFHHIWDNSSH